MKKEITINDNIVIEKTKRVKVISEFTKKEDAVEYYKSVCGIEYIYEKTNK